MTAKIHLRYARELAEESNIADIAEAGSLWAAIRHEVKLRADFEPIMSTFFHATVLNHDTFEGALSFLLASKLDSPVVSSMAIREIFEEAYRKEPAIIHAAEIDIKAIRSRDPACNSYSTPLLFYKGFHALQSHRVAHWLWGQERHSLAFYLQNQMSAISASIFIRRHRSAAALCWTMQPVLSSVRRPWWKMTSPCCTVSLSGERARNPVTVIRKCATVY